TGYKTLVTFDIIRALEFVPPTKLFLASPLIAGQQLPCNTVLGNAIGCNLQPGIVNISSNMLVPAFIIPISASTNTPYVNLTPSVIPCFHVALGAYNNSNVTTEGVYAQLDTASLTLTTVMVADVINSVLIPSSQPLATVAKVGPASPKKLFRGTTHEFEVCGLTLNALAMAAVPAGSIYVPMILNFTATGSSQSEYDRSTQFSLEPLFLAVQLPPTPGEVLVVSPNATIAGVYVAASSGSTNASCCSSTSGSNSSSSSSTTISCAACYSGNSSTNTVILMQDATYATIPVNLQNATYFGSNNRLCSTFSTKSLTPAGAVAALGTIAVNTTSCISAIDAASLLNISYGMVSIDIYATSVDNLSQVMPVNTTSCIAPIDAASLLNISYGMVSIDIYATSVDNLSQVIFTTPVLPVSSSDVPSLTLQLAIRSVQGCATSVFPGTADCVVVGGDVITIQGTGFPLLVPLVYRSQLLLSTVGSVSFDITTPSPLTTAVLAVSVSIAFAAGNNVSCTLLSMTLVFGSTDTILCALGYGGYGSAGIVQIRNTSTGVLLVSSESRGLVSFTAAASSNSTAACLVAAANGLRCSGNGNCSLVTGLCTCAADPVAGYWTGVNCSTCDPRYNASTGCTVPCPVGSNGLICSGVGVCGAGLCTCTYGYGGSDCSASCPGDTAPCSGHGTCLSSDATCVCYNSTALGFFTGSSCSSCTAPWSGTNCNRQCPKNNVTGVQCSAAGSCYEGACYCNVTRCGPACEYATSNANVTSLCDLCTSPTNFGTNCSGTCPGTSTANSVQVCSGNGACSNNRYGTGLCMCNAGFALSDCSSVCPRDSTGAVCGGAARGWCSPVSALCICEAAFAGQTCSVACPTGTGGLVCSGHGQCDSGSSGSGSCTCDLFYRGTNCNETCTGATPLCSGHGACQQNGTCSCYDDVTLGHWNGTSCSLCSTEWNGPTCTSQCARGTNGLQCSGHGSCSLTTCTCYGSLSSGFWTGDICNQCQSGYFGATCASACPGGSCSPCNGRGNCSDGINGTGLCTCQITPTATQGSYSGLSCESCAAGYYGESCQGLCPQSPISAVPSAPLAVCGSKGTCSDGTDGTGACTCSVGFASPNATASCTLCASGFFGASCTRCPSTTTVPCSGQGTCTDGLLGSGVCTCNPGFGGSNCSLACPVANNITCGRGTCVANQTCSCATNFALASNGTCTVCASGRWGADCSQSCPACARGSCSTGGVCVCPAGYWGTLCDTQCPAGAANPCNNHGVCNAATGVCTCYNNSAQGFFTGVPCDVCQANYASTTCRVPCPTVSGVVCNGRGTCFNGRCTLCHPLSSEASSTIAICGNACELRDRACYTFTNLCTTGKWGPGCPFTCPGTDAAFTFECTNNGLCDSDSGVCICKGGYYGTACEFNCASGLVNGVLLPCSGRGTCSGSVCQCYSGYFGSTCSEECPGGAATPCNGRGNCSTSGYCTCDGSAYGTACDTPCPGGFALPCNLQGSCTATGACLCYSDPLLGYYAGADCSACYGSYSGPHCNVTCPALTGAVVGKTCVCSTGFVGADCSIACPVSPADDNNLGGVCDHHGSCVVVSATAAMCACDANYYGKACNTFCTTAYCTTNSGLYRSQCNSVTGACECLQSLTNGYFAGPTCADCVGGYWGSECNFECPCNRHGFCDRYVGTCSCFQDNNNGYWSGTYCADCTAGYIGSDCKTKNIEMAPASSAITSVTNVGYPNTGLTFVDTQTSMALIGSNPLALIDVRNVSHTVSRGALTLVAAQDSSLTVVAALARIVNATHLRLTCIVNGQSIGYATIPRNVTLLATLTTVHVYSTIAASAASRTFSTLATTALLTASSSTCFATAIAQGFSVTVACDSGFSVTLAFADNNSAITSIAFATDNYLIVSGSTSVIDDGSSSASSSSSSGSSSASSGPAGWLRAVYDASNSFARIFHSNFTSAPFGVCALRNPPNSNSRCTEALPCVTFPLFDPNYLLCAWKYVVVDAITGDVSSTSIVFARTFLANGSVDLSGAQPQVVDGVAMTAFTADASYGLAIAAINSEASPSTVYKIQQRTLALRGAFTIPFTSANIPLVVDLVVDDPNRLLHISVATTLSAQLLMLNLFGIETIAPYVVDLRGGAIVTVYGEGFTPADKYQCLFGAVPSLHNATYVDSNTLSCEAPEALEGVNDSVCLGTNFNLRIGSRATEVSLVPIFRPVSASPTSTVTSNGGVGFGTSLAPTSITLSGFGFIVSDAAACMFIGPPVNSTNSSNPLFDGEVYFITMNVTYINSTAVVCHQPSALVAPSVPPSLIYYSHDNTTYSLNGASYASVGVFHQFRIENANSSLLNGQTITVVAQRRSLLPSIILRSADRNNNAMGPLDKEIRSMRCSGVNPLVLLGGVPELGVWSNDTIFTNSMSLGVTTFTQMTFALPAAGSYPIYCFDPADFTNFVQYTVVVVVGNPFGLQLISKTQTWSVGVQSMTTLAPNPAIAVVDVANNVISSAKQSQQFPPIASLTFTIRQPNPVTGEIMISSTVLNTAPNSQGQYEFANVQVRTTFDTPLQLSFVASSSIATLLTPAIAQQNCVPGAEYAVTGTFTCAPCPEFGICDGTSNVAVVPGNWRANRKSYTFYSCDPPDACPQATTCAAGYEGALCGSCAAGYGMSGTMCMPCLSQTLNYTFTALLCVGMIVLVYVLSIMSMPFSSIEDHKIGMEGTETQKKPPFSILFKILISHQQILGAVPVTDLSLPTWLSQYFTTSKSASSFNPNLSFISCAIADGAEGSLLLTVAAVPLLIGVFALICLIFAKLANKKFIDVQTKDREVEIDVDGKAKRLRYLDRPVESQLADMVYIEENFNKEHRLEVLKSHAQLFEWTSVPSNTLVHDTMAGADLPSRGSIPFEQYSESDEREESVTSSSEGSDDSSEVQGGDEHAIDIGNVSEFKRPPSPASDGPAMPKPPKRSSSKVAWSEAFEVDGETELMVSTSGDVVARPRSPPSPNPLRRKSTFSSIAPRSTFQVGDAQGRKIQFMDPTAIRPAPPLWTRWFNMLMLVSNVVLFFFYPSIVANCINALQCKTLDLGAVGSIRVLSTDPSVNCDSEQYKSTTLRLAVIFLVTFGFGTPLISTFLIVAVQRVTCAGNLHVARQMFFFATGGYRMWFWEGISLCRKAMIVVAVALVPKGELRTLSVAWIMMLFLGLTALADPWEYRQLSVVESASFGTVTLTYSLLTFLYTSDVANNDIAKTFILVIIVVMNLCFFVFFVSNFIWSLKKHLLENAHREPVLMEIYTKLFHRSLEGASQDIHSLREDIALTRHKLRTDHPHSSFTAFTEALMEADISVLEQQLQLQQSGRGNLRKVLGFSVSRVSMIDLIDVNDLNLSVNGSSYYPSHSATLRRSAGGQSNANSRMLRSGGADFVLPPEDESNAALGKSSSSWLGNSVSSPLIDLNVSQSNSEATDVADFRQQRSTRRQRFAPITTTTARLAAEQQHAMSARFVKPRSLMFLVDAMEDIRDTKWIKAGLGNGRSTKAESGAITPQADVRLDGRDTQQTSATDASDALVRSNSRPQRRSVVFWELRRNSNETHGSGSSSDDEDESPHMLPPPPAMPSTGLEELHGTSTVVSPSFHPTSSQRAVTFLNNSPSGSPLMQSPGKPLGNSITHAAAFGAQRSSASSSGELQPNTRSRTLLWTQRQKIQRLLVAVANYRALAILMPLEMLRLDRLVRRIAPRYVYRSTDEKTKPIVNDEFEQVAEDMSLNYLALMQIEKTLFEAWLDVAEQRKLQLQ
ncbi:transmembrane protein, putative, partial [Bodo saltans]